ncbi:MAG: FG-GAP-like repeat-containing protein [Phycisphaerales bacterium]|nr:FG-GAP-like repeat-containing protein [Phycisphaerales bacterium]
MIRATLGCYVLFVLLLGCKSDPPADGPVPAQEFTAAQLAKHNDAVAVMGAFDYQGAVDILQELANEDPSRDQFQVDLAIATLNRQMPGDETVALQLLEGVLSRQPDNMRAAYTAGLLRLNAGDIEGAQQLFADVASQDPEDAFAAYYLGQTRMQLGDMPGALTSLRRAIDLDPYLRSALYAGAQAARRAGDTGLAASWLDTFQRMEHNPRAHLAELKYTRMGPKAELAVLNAQLGPPPPQPPGPLFDEASASVLQSAEAVTVNALSAGWIDGTLHVLAAGDGSSMYRLEQEGDESKGMVIRGPMASPFSDLKASAALWGDVDSDGQLDVVLCGDGINQLWLGRGDGGYELDQRFETSKANTVDGALFDADHDGDLDVLMVNDGQPCQLLGNNGDGSWRTIRDETSGFPESMVQGRQVVVSDFDGDLDTDVLLIGQSPPHMLWANDRLWAWSKPEQGWDGLLQAEVSAAVAADLNADGQIDLITSQPDASVKIWSRGEAVWSSEDLAAPMATPPHSAAVRRHDPLPRQLAVADLDGDGQLDVVAESAWGLPDQQGAMPLLQVLRGSGQREMLPIAAQRWMLCDVGSSQGPGLLVAESEGMKCYPPGTGRFSFVNVLPQGRTDTGQSMRSNMSGIGTHIAARVEDRWTITGGVRSNAGPGQSLQPYAIGLGGAADVDFVAIDWTDGVFQTESRLAPGPVHEIAETQRQLSSCPVIFAWDGSSMQFMTDCLGVAGLGFLLGPDRYAPPRPLERVLLSADVIKPRDGHYEFIIAEPMQETCYLDAVLLETIDCPPGWQVVPDERMGTGEPMPSSELLFYRHQQVPDEVLLHGVAVTEQAAVADGVALDPGHRDVRFLGRLLEPLNMELRFDEMRSGSGEPMLLIDGWVEYPYSQTMFAAWQAGRTYRPISIDAQGSDGDWVRLHTEIGYPAGMPRRSVFPLHGLPDGCRAIRLSTDLELYVDAASVVWVEPCAEAVVHLSTPLQANLEAAGFPRRIDGALRKPGFDWARRSPLWDTRTQRGWYDQLGDVLADVGTPDGTVAVFGTGDAVRCRFDPVREQPAGWVRRHVLVFHGWCKDMDLMTRDSGSVEPVPGEGSTGRTRYRSGR